MSFADDLLAQAYHLASKERKNAKQASLRRSVSTAYYALFHLLIDEAVGNWAIPHQRSILARTFDHGRMKSLCEARVHSFYRAKQPAAGLPLKLVAETFVSLQENRHTADYDHAVHWDRVATIEVIDEANAAFRTWRAIRTQPDAQDFLLSLFLPKPPRA
jgi:uncharacterized protein (UPF0332 family)